MAELKGVHLTKADLDRIPADERYFYLMAGHLANDVNILGKLLLMASNSAFRKDGEILEKNPHRQAGLAQMFLVLKLLAGRLYEASRLIGTHYFGKGLDTKYENEMREKARDARLQFSRYFGEKANVIKMVRHKFAFHLQGNRDAIESVYNEVDGDYPFVQYLGEEVGSNLFIGSEMILLNAMAKLVNAQTPLDGIEKIRDDTVKVSAWLMLFVTGYMSVMMRRYIMPVKGGQVEKITIEEAPSISLYSLPFFAGAPEGYATSSVT
jgi:hypothetical protein